MAGKDVAEVIEEQMVLIAFLLAQSDEYQILFRIAEQDLSEQTQRKKSVRDGELAILLGHDIVPAIGIGLIVNVGMGGTLDPSTAHYPAAVVYAPVQIQLAYVGEIARGCRYPSIGLCMVVFPAVESNVGIGIHLKRIPDFFLEILRVGSAGGAFYYNT